MIYLFILSSLFFFVPTNSINVLVYSPAFAASHTNFMARLADTLAGAGHNVTFLVPIVDVASRHHFGVQITTDVFVIEQDEITSRASVPFDDSMEAYWTEHTDSSNVIQSFKWFFDGMSLGCENFLRNHKPILDQLKTRHFDVAIVEPVSICGLAYAKYLGIDRTILASSCAYYDFIFRNIGEPDHFSYLPTLVGMTGDQMDFWQRLENYRVAEKMYQGFSQMFDLEQKSIQKYLGETIPNWRELLPDASLFFTNSNPYLDFPRPVIQKTVQIGGISVNMEKIKSTKLDHEWEEILSRRDHNMLISFGSMVQSAHMLDDARQNLLKVIKSEPNVTFIWKYETNDTSFAEGVENIIFSKWVPQAALLNDNRLTAFLTHGGLGSTNELAYSGKPAVMVPIFADQYRNAHMLARHGGVTVVQKTLLADFGVMLLHLLILHIFCLLPSISCLNILVYSPAFAASHSNFLGKLADTLTERGHNVTYLVPVVENAKRGECIGVKLTKDVVIVEAGEEMMRKKQDDTPSDEILEVFWKAEMDSSNSRDLFKWFSESMITACQNFHSRRDIFDAMKSRNFDVAILEPISACGLGFVKALGIEKTILASSCTFFDVALPHIGEPLEFSYVPAGFSVSSEVMSMFERLENWLVTREVRIVNEGMFDGEMKSYREFLGEELPDWRHLLPEASLFFVNSHPFIDFPRPVLQKTVPIGGIQVNLEWIKQQKLSEEWEEILNKRPLNMLISFGSMVKSTHMPKKWKNGLLEIIKSTPNVTFIWKYESEDISFAEGIENIHFSKWVPQTALLNDDRLTAFVTHGGLGSTMELAHSGKPAVMIPIIADQIRNAKMLERHHGIVYLHKNSMEDVQMTKQAFEAVLYDEKYKRSAQKLAKLLANQPYSPKDYVIKYTEYLGEYGPFPRMDPYGRHLNYFQKTFLDIFALFALTAISAFLLAALSIRFVCSKISSFKLKLRKEELKVE
uniref:glucuronosyltransferase n=1 Tax=Caenorhabditis japonica TaxID=281687 RepID=A0A8R1HU38_CAEJA